MSDSLSTLDLVARAEALCAAATAGPWVASRDAQTNGDYATVEHEHPLPPGARLVERIVAHVRPRSGGLAQADADAAFIAEARDLLPALAAAARAACEWLEPRP